MKIAIPTRNNQVDSHFGHCDHYSIITVSAEKTIERIEPFEAPQGCGCKSNIAGILAEMGVKNMLAGNIGQGAINKIQAAGIDLVRGCSGDITEVTQAFLRNELADSGNNCSHHSHEEGHQCEH